VADFFKEGVCVDGLLDETGAAVRLRPLAVQDGAGRHDDRDGRLWDVALELLQEMPTVEYRHEHVQQDQRGRRMTVQVVQRFLAVCGQRYLVPRAAQDGRQPLTGDLIVLDHQERSFVAHLGSLF